MPLFRLSWLVSTLVVITLLLSACTSTQELTPESNKVSIAANAQLQLSAPPKALVGTSLTQIMDIQVNDEQHTLLIQTDFTATGIYLVAISPSGIPVVTITFATNAPLVMQQYVPGQQINPANIIADLQLAMWPMSDLNHYLEGDNVSLRQVNSNERLLVVADKTVMRISKDTAKTHIEHSERGYQITLSLVE
jgi:hypothetical protein